MVRQWQERLFNRQYSHTPIESPDYVKLAEAYGAVGLRALKSSEVDDVIKEALSINRPVFMDFVTEGNQVVYPWVLAGKPINQVLLTNECQSE